MILIHLTFGIKNGTILCFKKHFYRSFACTVVSVLSPLASKSCGGSHCFPKTSSLDNLNIKWFSKVVKKYKEILPSTCQFRWGYIQSTLALQTPRYNGQQLNPGQKLNYRSLTEIYGHSLVTVWCNSNTPTMQYGSTFFPAKFVTWYYFKKLHWLFDASLVEIFAKHAWLSSRKRFVCVSILKYCLKYRCSK